LFVPNNKICGIKSNWSSELEARIDNFLNRFPVDKMMFHAQVPHTHVRFEMVGPIGPICKSISKFGFGDEEKRACVDFSRTHWCRVISIGSNNQWGFEMDVFQKTNCHVDTFDCTVPQGTKPPESIRERVVFHNLCIGVRDEKLNGREFVTWKTLLRRLNMKNPPDFVKMDIEGFEWSVIPSMLSDSSILPDQIAFELHFSTYRDLSLGWAKRSKSAEEIAVFIDQLYRLGRYFVVDRNDNPHCSHCSELLVARDPHLCT
jgi:hypothetical protein